MNISDVVRRGVAGLAALGLFLGPIVGAIPAASAAPGGATCTVHLLEKNAWVADQLQLQAECSADTVLARFEVRGAGAGWEPLAEHDQTSGFGGTADVSALVVGDWELQVIAVDGQERSGPPSAARAFHVDRTAPWGQWQYFSVALDGTSVVGNGEQVFGLASNDPSPHDGYCQVRPAGGTAEWSVCGPTGATGFVAREFRFTPAVSGVYEFQMRLIDRAGNTVDSTPIPFTVDLDAPVIAIDLPAEGSAVPTREVTLPIGIDEPAMLECRFGRVGDATAVFGPCTTPGAPGTPGSYAAAGLSDGAYLLTVRATDGLGNTAQSSRTFTVDTLAPTLGFESGPAAGARLSTRSTVFGFATDDPEATLSCLLQRAGAARASYLACSGADRHQLRGLADGGYTLTVRATDPAGNTATVSRSFTLDATAPVTRVITAPRKKVRIRARRATVAFGFAAGEPATYRCRLDAQAWRSCADLIRLRVRPGKHVLRVVAVDRGGLIDPTPVVVRWRVIRR